MNWLIKLFSKDTPKRVAQTPADGRGKPLPPWVAASGLGGAFKAMKVNPYRKIMMTCPNRQDPTFTGVNSSYFDEWNGNPPIDGASFRCALCGDTHKFDATNTWLENL